MSKTRILYIVSHPIQYQAPLLRLISQSNDMAVKAIFYWDLKAEKFFDGGFQQEIKWDVPVLDGYSYAYLSGVQNKKSTLSKLVTLWKVIDKKNTDVVWTHGYADLYTAVGIIFAKTKGIKVFVRGESLFFPDEKNSFFKKLKKKIFFRFLNLLVGRYLAIGTNNKLFYLENKIPDKKIFLCNYAVNNDFFYRKYCESKNKIAVLKSKMNLDPNRPIILYASKFIKRKYPIDLLHAYQSIKWESNSKPYLLFIGTGETLESVKKNALSDSVLFLGFKNQTELPDFFAMSDILVLPSEHENWGLIVNEAMNAECAIVISDHVGCGPDLVRHGENGYIYPARNIKKLAEYLQILIENPTLCEKMKIKSGEIISHWGLKESVEGLRRACKSFQK